MTADAEAGIFAGYDPDPTESMSLHADAYTDARWHDLEQREVFARSWQWVGHVESLREPGDYTALDVAGMPIAVVRGDDGVLRAFYNVCQHRAHALLTGTGHTGSIVCPYHGWAYDLSGSLHRARHTDDVAGFDPSTICLTEVQVEEFGGFVYVNLDHQPHRWPPRPKDSATRSLTGHQTWKASPTSAASVTTSPPTGRTWSTTSWSATTATSLTRTS